ncbi:phenylacetate--CoA ligase family protein [Mesohalobacter salilacus]|uniref:phenylacetate--CoA ligase family protein n=1 Tax=Mesohalobacter salilacus TaxID=2491711 RepID=UPI00403E839F
MNRFERVLELSGFALKSAKQHLLQIEKELQKDTNAYVKKKRQDIFHYHLKHNSFYQKFVNQNDIQSWDDIPIMTKANLQQPLEERLSEGYKLKDVFVSKTSGSSGHPFSFAKDKYCHALTWANIIKLYQQHDIEMGKSLEARFYGIPKSGLSHYKERLKDKFAKRYRFDIFDLSDEALAEFLKAFQTKPFEFINGYTSSIVRFAKYLKSQNIVLREECPSLKLCITTSEMLFENDRLLLEKQIGVKVVNEYGASELGVIAFENFKNEWLINTKTLLVEVVDETGKALPFGEEGEIVITSLYNKAHPFIRYKIGDRGVLSLDSKSGQPILKQLTGRTNDFAKLPSGKVIPALTFYYVTKSAIENSGQVKEIVVVQNRKDQFDIIYVADRVLSDPQKQTILEAIEKYLEPDLKINFNQKTQIKRSKSGKLKQFESKI